MNKKNFLNGLLGIGLALAGAWAGRYAAVPIKGLYVNQTNGSDSYACTEAQPCRSYARAESLAAAGDVIYFSGVYTSQVDIRKDGVTVDGVGSAVIDTSSQNGIAIHSNRVTVRGFEVKHTRSHAIIVHGQYATVSNNIVHHAILENGVINSDGTITCFNNNWGSGLKAERGSAWVTFADNQVYSVCGEGAAATMSNNVVFANNKIRDSKNVNLYIDNSVGVKAYGNEIVCSQRYDPNGIAIGEEYYSGWGAQLRDVDVYGNTISNCKTGIIILGSQVGGTATNVLIHDNVVFDGVSFGISVDAARCSGVSITNNVIWTTYIWTRCSGVIKSGNILFGATVTPALITPTISRTATPIAAIPTLTRTITPTFVSPTLTATEVGECYEVRVGDIYVGDFCP